MMNWLMEISMSWDFMTDKSVSILVLEIVVQKWLSNMVYTVRQIVVVQIVMRMVLLWIKFAMRVVIIIVMHRLMVTLFVMVMLIIMVSGVNSRVHIMMWRLNRVRCVMVYRLNHHSFMMRFWIDVIVRLVVDWFLQVHLFVVNRIGVIVL